MKVALLCNPFGLSRTYRGGPSIYAHSAHKALDRLGVLNHVYYTIPGVDPYYLDDHCFQAKMQGKQIPKTDKTAMEEQGYTVYHCLNSADHALLCQKAGIKPILGPNIIPNSPPDHCVKYLSKEELLMRRDQITQERAIIKVLKAAV